MSLKFTRFSETVDVDHIETGSNGNSTSEPIDPRLQTFQQSTSFLSKTKCQTIIIIVIALLIIASFITGISLLVKCDEGKLITHFEERRTTFEKAITAWAENHQKEKLNIEDSYKSEKIKWVADFLFDELVMEPAGNELYGHDTILVYVARASHLNGTVVGKYVPSLGEMYIGYDGLESTKPDFELLTFPRGTLSWIPFKNEVLSNEQDLVLGGAAPITGEKTFICRGKTQDHLILGKYLKSIGKCLVAYSNMEFGLYNFEILTVNAMGKIIGADE